MVNDENLKTFTMDNQQESYLPIDKIYRKSDKGFEYSEDNVPLDPFCEEPYELPRTHHDHYFMKWYGLTTAQVYNLLTTNDLNTKHYCKYCGSEVYFVAIWKGYPDFCCRNCANAYLSNREDLRESHRAHMRELNDYNNQDSGFQAWVHFKGFLSRGDLLDNCFLYTYYDRDSKFYKFGVCNDKYRKSSLLGLNVHELLSSTRLIVATFEYSLSLLFNGEWYQNYKKFKEIYSYMINNYLYKLDSSTTIEQANKIVIAIVEYFQVKGNGELLRNKDEDIVSTSTEM